MSGPDCCLAPLSPDCCHQSLEKKVEKLAASRPLQDPNLLVNKVVKHTQLIRLLNMSSLLGNQMETMIEKLVAAQPTGIRSGSRNRIQKSYQTEMRSLMLHQ